MISRTITGVVVLVTLASGCASGAGSKRDSDVPVTVANGETIPRWPPVSMLPDEFFP